MRTPLPLLFIGRIQPWRALAFSLGVAAGLVFGRALARSAARESRSGDIIAHAHEAIIATNAEQHIVLANPAAAAMFATTIAAMLGKRLDQFIKPPPASDGSATMAFFGDSRGGRRATDYAITGTRADGTSFPLEGSVSTMHEGDATLTTIILRDVSARHLVQDKLARSHAALRQLSAALQTVREEERTHIARELHDDLGQLLASLRMDLTWLQQADASPASTAVMATMESHLLTAITSLRRIATNLRPRALDDGGLFFALQGLCAEFAARYGVACQLYADEAELRLDDTASTAIFRIVQEALTNIARHAQAHMVSINAYRIDGELLITIRDDGRGIVEADFDKPESLGLVGMRERVWGLHGDITISADEPPGTRIDIVLPLARALEQTGAPTTTPPS
jgi:PAS domain S-box-containing protein